MNVSPLLLRLPTGADLLEELTNACAGAEVTRGSVQVIGALKRAKTGYYHQADQRYESHEFDEALEILAGLGNVSLKDGKPFVHLHLTLGRADGSCIGGHAMPGCEIFAAEALITPIAGAPLVREPDETTGLPLWRRPE